MSRRLLYVVPLVLFGGLALLFAVQLGHDPKIVPSALIDREVPEFELPPLKDGKGGLSTADLRGQVALVNVFASWCIPCRAEHPILMELSKREDVAIFGINYKNRPEEAKAWLAELGDPYDRIGVDRSGRASIDWGVYGVPETFVVDRNGRIRYKVVGPMTPKELNGTVLPLIQELAQ